MSRKPGETYSEPVIREWLTILDGLKQENIRLQHRLSDTIRIEVKRSSIEEAEAFQQKFIDIDQVIALLRYDITALLKQLQQTPLPEIPRTHQARQLEKDMQKIISRFSQVEASFNDYRAGGKHLAEL